MFTGMLDPEVIVRGIIFGLALWLGAIRPLLMTIDLVLITWLSKPVDAARLVQPLPYPNVFAVIKWVSVGLMVSYWLR